MPSNQKDGPIIEYENNPFTVATDGLNALFKYARSIAILLALLSLVTVTLNVLDSTNQLAQPKTPSSSSSTSTLEMPENIPYETWVSLAAIIGIFLLGLMIIGLILSGISDYASARVADKEETNLKEAFIAVIKKFPGYVLLQIIVFIKVFLWSLLLIVPGIIMSVRYSLSGTSYFRSNMKPLEAIDHSTRITKGAWFTTFASSALFNLITFGLISMLLQPGVRGILHRQYEAYNSLDKEKPGIHPLSYITLALVIGLVLILLALIAAAVFILTHYDILEQLPSGGSLFT